MRFVGVGSRSITRLIVLGRVWYQNPLIHTCRSKLRSHPKFVLGFISLSLSLPLNNLTSLTPLCQSISVKPAMGSQPTFYTLYRQTRFQT